ncbi:hypothetical protein L9F63_014282, partial [Diploptera punctata]
LKTYSDRFIFTFFFRNKFHRYLIFHEKTPTPDLLDLRCGMSSVPFSPSLFPFCFPVPISQVISLT